MKDEKIYIKSIKKDIILILKILFIFIITPYLILVLPFINNNKRMNIYNYIHLMIDDFYKLKEKYNKLEKKNYKRKV